MSDSSEQRNLKPAHRKLTPEENAAAIELAIERMGGDSPSFTELLLGSFGKEPQKVLGDLMVKKR